MMTNRLKDKSDEELVFAYRSGDAAAADELIERYKQLVRARARKLYLTGGDRDDLLQEGMLGIFKAIRGFDPDKKDGAAFRTFASVCVDRQLYSAIMTSRRQKNQPLNMSVSLDAFEPDSVGTWFGTSESPETLLLGAEAFRQKVQEIKELLSSYEGRVLDLYLDGLNYTEIAEILGKTPKSVDNALSRIKSKVSVYYKK